VAKRSAPIACEIAAESTTFYTYTNTQILFHYACLLHTLPSVTVT
jgi:hypothetical protein